MNNQDFSADLAITAIKSLDNFLYSIARNVICTICQELFIEAVTNQCGHSFCSKCIKRFQTTSKYKKVNCPLCRHPIKYRAGTDNSILSKLAELCSEAPEAFKEDVKKLTNNFEDVQEELMKSMRIPSICEEKFKDDEKNKKEAKNKKKNDKVDDRPTKSNDSLTFCSVLDDNMEILDLKSVSQTGSNSDPCVTESPSLENKLRNVKIVTKQKVSSWLQNLNENISSSPDTSHFENIEREKLFTSRNDRNVISLGKSMIRIDYIKSKNSNETSVLGENDDPYEFIVSQRNTSAKRKSKRTRPQFEKIQNFDKEKLPKRNNENKAAALENEASIADKVQKPIRTYSTRFKQNSLRNETRESVVTKDEIITRKRRGHELSDKVESCSAVDIADDDSDVVMRKSKPHARRRILSPYSESNDSFDSNALHKQKINDDGCDNASCNKKKNIENSLSSNKCSRSPGWSRVTNLKMDFENAGKRYRPCRKTLDISGGDLSVNSIKMKTSAEISSEINKNMEIPNENYSCADYLNQESILQNQNHEKIDFKVDEEYIAKEPEGVENTCFEAHGENQLKSENVTNAANRSNNATLCRTGNRNTIPFALLGKIKKKKNVSIVFVKMGRLSPFLAKPGRTIVKLVFPSINRQKTSVKVQTNESRIETDTNVSMENTHLKSLVKAKVDVGVQSNPNPSYSKEIQPVQEKERKNIAIQTEICLPSQIFEELDKQASEVETGNDDADNELNTELHCELNKTWAVTQQEMFDNAGPNMKNGKITVDGGSNELINSAINNENLNRHTRKDDQFNPISIKSAEICEESDSDIFIEQTPPRIEPVDRKEGNPIQEVVENEEESFLILSECPSNIPHQDKSKFDPIKRTENDENNRNEPNPKSQDAVACPKFCIVTSGIRNRKIIDKFVKKFKVEYSSVPKREMTHLVVGLHENEDYESVPYCTPKFLYAIANKKWIVTESWVEECLKSKEVVREEPFESVDPIGGNGCNIARKSTGLLLTNWEIYLYGEFVTITKEEFAELIKDCGGTIVPHLKDFSYTGKKIRMILLDGSASQKEQEEYATVSKRYRTLVMSRDVAIMSIQSYQTVNFTPFVQHQFSIDECVKWGYPLHLVKKDINFDDSNSDGCTQ